ncbi:putative carbonic anhydrase 3 [Patella vulgata]|uniref:putative carbonic anhydrase 3 n=1 Tax=Patella vulgata TaxID=6465 RepID=UPI0024A8CCDD|nr:putative carbonic anhydrase 3 [Patella vulgata]
MSFLAGPLCSPSNWAQAYSTCGENSQSPINIKISDTTLQASLGNMTMTGYDTPVALTIKNNGHTAQVDVTGNQYISNGGLSEQYKLAQFHFHWGSDDTKGSEHQLNSRTYPMEVTLMNFIPSNPTNFFRYSGSLTTPSCNEVVVWTVFTETIKISKTQMATFRTLMSSETDSNNQQYNITNNFRPVQPLYSRPVLSNFYSSSATTAYITVYTAQVDVTGNQYISNGGLSEQYKLAQFHFHWGSDDTKGSEHQLNSRTYPMEVHLVHYKTSLGSLGNAVDLVSLNNTALMNFIPSNPTNFFRYSGSLTTPSCNEVVVWTVFTETIKISKTQMATFRTLMSSETDSNNQQYNITNNFRPVQPLYSRPVLSNFYSSSATTAYITVYTGVLSLILSNIHSH